MDLRKKEDKLYNSLKDPDVERKTFGNIIDKTLYNNNKVWLTTDWHLWLREEKGMPYCKKRSDFNKIINNMNKKVKPNDLLIMLGDIVDGEFQNKEELKPVILSLPGTKILVKGNNDLFTDKFYESCGFDKVVESFKWNDILFTHIPCDPTQHKCSINIHGHIHGYKTYWVPYNKMIDVAYLNGRKEPVELKHVIDSLDKYSKLIKEDPSHFNEYSTYECIDDPFND